MATVNIGGVQDEHYRYKMPKLQAKIEGRGNGIRTNIVNNVDIAKSLARPPLYLLKHFGVELGAQTRFEENTGNSIVNGAHDDKKLVEVLNQFIKAYVQCGECNNPETTMHVKKEIITLKCKACGAKTEVDMRHKLNSYIIKNPPPKEKKIGKSDKALKETKEAAKDSKDKKKKKPKKSSSHGDDENEGKENGNAGEGSSKELPVASKEEHEHEEDDEDEEENDNEVWMTDTSAAAVRARAQEQLSDATRDMVSIGNLEAEAEARRRKEAKAKEEERKKKEEESIPEDADNDAEEDEDAEEEEEDEDEEQEIIDKLRGLIPVKPAAAIVKALNNLEVEGGLVQKMRLLYEAVFGEVGSGQMAAVMSKRSELFTMFGAGTKGQAAQMVVFEYFVGVAHSAKISETPHVLKVMYDNDIVEEEVMKQWYENPSIGFKLMKVPPAVGKAVRDAASIVIEQLLDDDEEEEEEEEEEE
eukprot:TRINITY_DN1887_c0_g2_i3.p1 TRINITY_DN1887_c0_g2~~TRINITY_DN1887_c0_g2_i3.p1  ORF type:complete len:472 (+),score=157.41 TRINITY_DN1887_c0_g2_i3:262-1677(+)